MERQILLLYRCEKFRGLSSACSNENLVLPSRVLKCRVEVGWECSKSSRKAERWDQKVNHSPNSWHYRTNNTPQRPLPWQLPWFQAQVSSPEGLLWNVGHSLAAGSNAWIQGGTTRWNMPTLADHTRQYRGTEDTSGPALMWRCVT